MPTSEQLEQTVHAYIDAMQSGNRAAFLAQFAADAVTQDPVPGPLNQGPDAIAAWWDGMIAPMEKIAFEVHDLHLCGDQAAMIWTITATPPGGAGSIQMKGVDIFTVADDGKIRSMYAYWDPSKIVAA